MRENQKEYFSNRTGLATCRRLERDVDKRIKELLSDNGQKQLFGE